MPSHDLNISQTLSGLERICDLSITSSSPHFIVLSHLFSWIKKDAFNVAKGVMLDYGCGGQPYKEVFSSKVTKYIGADVVAAKGVSLDVVFEPNKPLPLETQSIDTILSTQALEHASDVDFYLSECARLMKPDGVLILTAPMQWRHHEAPYDYHRFTRYGLIEYLERNGFAVKEMSQCGGVYALLGQIFLNHLSEKGILNQLVYRSLNKFFLWLDRKYYDPEDTINWLCLAEKRTDL